MALATLSIDLEARLGRMEASLAQAERSAAKSSASISKSLGSIGDVGAKLGGIFAGLVGALGASAIVTQVRTVIDGFDAFNDAADATGATIEKLSALEEVGNRTGTSFDSVTGILVKFNKVLDEAGDKDSGAAKALAAIGLQAEELRRLDPAEALQRTARALAGFADDGNKARLVQELFGKSVREAAPFLKDLAEAGELNGRVTREQADAAERFNKNLFALQANVANLGRSLLGDLLPSINAVFERWKEMDKLFGSLANAPWLRGGLRTGGGLLAGGDFEQGAQKTRAVIAELETDLARLGKASSGRFGIDTSREQERLRARLDEERKLLAYFNQRTAPEASYSNEGRAASALPSVGPVAAGKTGNGAKRPAFSLPDSVLKAGFIDDQELGGLLAGNLAKQIDATERELDRGLAEWDRYTKQVDDFSRGLQIQTADINNSLIKSDRERGEAQIALDRQLLEERLAAMQLSADDQDRLQQNINANIAARQAQLTEQLKPEWQRMLEAWEGTAEQMAKTYDDLMGGVLARTEDVVADFVRTGKLSMDSLADYVQQTIARIIARKAIAGLAGAASDAFSLFTTGFARGGVFQGGSVVPFAAGGVVSSPSYFPMTGGRTGLMGEAGPEAIMPLKRGPGGRLGVQASGQAGTSVQINIAAGVTRQELAGIVPQLRESIRAELITSMRRPGWQGA